MTLNVLKATPAITWTESRGHRLRDRARRDAAERDGQRRRHLRLHAGSRDDAQRRRPQTLSVSFTPTDTANYNDESATVTFNVTKATPAITWPNPADIVYGTALGATQLNATADVAGTFTYTPAAGTTLDAGAQQTLSVSFTPTDTANYNDKSATVTLNVLKATRRSPGESRGHRLRDGAGATQLNATANVPGTFAYTPAAGTTLNAGAQQTLSVSFTPSRYGELQRRPATGTLNVLKATPVITWTNPADIVYGTALAGRS